MVTNKSTLTVARMALRAARDALPDYARPKSPKKFTQPQLVACLIVREFEGKDYRGIHTMLAEWSDLRTVLALTKVPHFTTLCQAAKRLFHKPVAERLLAATLALCRKAGPALGIGLGMAVTDELDNTIRQNAEGPKRAKGDSGEMEQHSLCDQIEAAKHLASKEASTGKGLGVRTVKLSPPGTA